jgi:hypothetical protein
MQTTAAITAQWIVLIFLAGVGLVILIKLYTNTIDLSGLLSEPATAAAATDGAGATAGGGAAGAAANPAGVGGAARPVGAGGVAGPGGVVAASTGKASMSRLQLLLFTFTIVSLFLTLSFEKGEMIDIPNQVLGLLGISGASYVVSKGIQAQAQKPT